MSQKLAAVQRSVFSFRILGFSTFWKGYLKGIWGYMRRGEDLGFGIFSFNKNIVTTSLTTSGVSSTTFRVDTHLCKLGSILIFASCVLNRSPVFHV